MRCFAHMLNLAAQEGIRQIATTVDALREGIKLLRTSPRTMNHLKVACSAQKVLFVRPVLDVSTRWNSTYDMISTALQMRVI